MSRGTFSNTRVLQTVRAKLPWIPRVFEPGAAGCAGRAPSHIRCCGYRRWNAAAPRR